MRTKYSLVLSLDQCEGPFHDVPLLKTKNGRIVRLSEGEESFMIQLRKLSIGSVLFALDVTKEQLQSYFHDELKSRVEVCRQIIRKRPLYAETGDRIPIREKYVWQEYIGMSSCYATFFQRAKRGNIVEHDLELLERFLNSQEVLIPYD